MGPPVWRVCNNGSACGRCAGTVWEVVGVVGVVGPGQVVGSDSDARDNRRSDGMVDVLKTYLDSGYIWVLEDLVLANPA
jgi:hypothetical protein